MGSITPYETASGKRYRVRYRKPDTSQTDKRGFKTKRDAELFLASVEVAKARGEFMDARASRVTVAELSEAWLLNREQALKPSAFRPIRLAWQVYVSPRWGSTSVADVKPSAVEQWIRELGNGTAKTDKSGGRLVAATIAKPKSATTVLRAYGVLASILDVAVKDGRVPKNAARAADNLPRKRSSKSRRYLSHAEVVALAEAVPDSMRSTLILLLAYSGLRWGEATALRLRDVNPLRRRVEVVRNAVEVGRQINVGTPKNGEARSVPFPAFLAEPLAVLCAGKGRDDLVFSDAAGDFLRRPNTSNNQTSWFLRALASADLERLTVHDLRHTAASLAVSSGAHVKAVQRMLGHKSAAMTLDVYADLFDDDLDAVAEGLNRGAAAANVGKLWANASLAG